MKFRLPKNSQRLSICGATGSGKTRFGIWAFSHSAFQSMPYIIVDFKGDDLIAQIDRAKEISLSDTVKHPGLYVVRPSPHELEAVDKFLWRIWERGSTGLFFDEGYMVNGSSALDAILTQGRSLKIPTTTLTQRPVWCSRFVFSEADYFCVFRLNDRRDYDTVRGLVPNTPAFNFENRLPAFHSRWYDVAQDYSCILKPVPGDDEILERYDDALRLRLKGI